MTNFKKRAEVVVAHPDDETLWAGGTILSNPGWDWNIFSLTRASDEDRATRFRQALDYYGASGSLGDMDDGSEQVPLISAKLERAVLMGLGASKLYDLVITHGPNGEYTRHRRHEEVSFCVTDLWLRGKLDAGELWLFAYEDGGGEFRPKPERGSRRFWLSERLWCRKKFVVEKIYGFQQGSWEAKNSPRIEAFWKFKDRKALQSWLEERDKL